MKKLNILSIIVLIANLIFMIYLIFFVDPIKSYTYAEYAYEKEQESLNDVSIQPQKGVFDVYDRASVAYDGELSLSYINNQIEHFVKVQLKQLHQQTTTLSQQALEAFYNENASNLSIRYGIASWKQFQELMTIVNQYTSDVYPEEVELVEESYVEGEEYDHFTIRIINNDQSIVHIKVSVINQLAKSKSKMIFQPLEEEI